MFANPSERQALAVMEKRQHSAIPLGKTIPITFKDHNFFSIAGVMTAALRRSTPMPLARSILS